MKKSILQAFPAFHSYNYRLYFLGQLVSLIGTWLQNVALGWLVFEITQSAWWVGVVTATGMIPMFFFSLFGGVLVDRYHKKHILYITQVIAMILSLLMGFLTLAHLINVTDILILAFCFGLVSALDIPARQSYVVEMVGKENLASAIAVNSGMFNAARIVGPAIAGILIALVGAGGAFVLNGLSFIAVLIALYFIHTQKLPKPDTPHPLHAIKQGLVYAFGHPVLKPMLLYTSVISIFGWSYTTLMPVIATSIYHVGPEGLGYLYVASGLGALAGAFFISVASGKLKTPVIILLGVILFCISLAAFSITTYFILALILLFISGFALIIQFATINTTIQHLVKDSYRGRVMSIYALMFGGVSFVGNFQAGYLAQNFGTGFAMQVDVVAVGLFGFLLFFLKRNQLSA